MLALDSSQATRSHAGGESSPEETSVSTQLCMALGLAAHLARAVHYSDDAVVSAYHALCQALRLDSTFHHVQPIADTTSNSQSRVTSTRIGPGQGCRRDCRSDDGSLSARQQSILELIASGLSNKEIARSLGISPETVKTHVTNIFIKLGTDRRAQAVAFAHTLGMIHNTTNHRHAI